MAEAAIERTKANLERNGFKVFLAGSAEEARIIFLERILPFLDVKSASYADSMTLAATGILDEVRGKDGIRFIDAFDRERSWDEKIELRRQALLVDLFLTGSNAITEAGQIVNLDMIGNRIGGITFGPKDVVLTVGRNKIVADVGAAMARVKAVSSVLNAKRHTSFSLPCQKTGRCMDCSGEERICNAWSILEKCFPRGRIKVIIIDEALGL